MEYFEDGNGLIYAYDPATQQAEIDTAIANKWTQLPSATTPRVFEDTTGKMYALEYTNSADLVTLNEAITNKWAEFTGQPPGMRYFKNSSTGNVHGYNKCNPNDAPWINDAMTAGWAEVTGNWPPSITLSEAQAAQNAVMGAACQSAIAAGFSSSGLGTAHTYGCKVTDQANINLSAIGGGSLWCEDSAGAWSFVAHTVAQAAQVQKDMIVHIQAQQATYAKALTDIAAATSVSAVDAITWATP